MGQLMQYRRTKTPGASYFFTVVTYQRQALFCELETVDLLRTAFRTIKSKLPFTQEIGVQIVRLNLIVALVVNDEMLG